MDCWGRAGVTYNHSKYWYVVLKPVYDRVLQGICQSGARCISDCTSAYLNGAEKVHECTAELIRLALLQGIKVITKARETNDVESRSSQA